MGKDLGTYHLRAEFRDGRGYITEINTGARYTHGSGNNHPLTAGRIPPTWDSEDDLISSMLFNYTENNWSCDCNRELDYYRSQQQEPPEDEDSGHCNGRKKFLLRRLTLIRPNGEEIQLWEGEEEAED